MGRKRLESRSGEVRNGDDALWAWGEAQRNGDLEALYHARRGGLSEGHVRIRQPGAYSNPTLSLMMIAEQHKLDLVVTVDREISRWRQDHRHKLLADVADVHYANPYKPTNDDTARLLGVSVRSVGKARHVMRKEVMATLRTMTAA